MKRLARYLVFYSVLIGIWFLLAKLKVWPPYVFPTPQGVLESVWAGFSDHSFTHHGGRGFPGPLEHPSIGPRYVLCS